MTTLKELLGIRPKPAATPAELAEAITRAEAAQREATERADSLSAQRGRVLLDGTPDEAAKAEAALASARNDAERAAALAEALRERLAEAERAERRADFDTKLSQAEQANARWRAFVEKDYPALAAMIAAGLLLEAAARRAADATHAALSQLPHDEREGLTPAPSPYLPPHPMGANYNMVAQFGLGGAVRLPAANGDNEGDHWPRKADRPARLFGTPMVRG